MQARSLVQTQLETSNGLKTTVKTLQMVMDNNKMITLVIIKYGKLRYNKSFIV